MTRFLIALCPWITGLISLAAQDTSFNPLGREISPEGLNKQIRIQVEWIELSHEDYTALMAEPNPLSPPIHKSNNDGPLRQKLTKMIAQTKAKIVDTSMVMARSGMRAKVESAQEYIYPSEYAVAERTEIEDASHPDKIRVTETAPEVPFPTAFETRDVGTTMEVDPIIGPDGVTISLNLSPETVEFARHENWATLRSDKGETDLKSPIFNTRRISMAVDLRAGEYLLIGVQSPFGGRLKIPDRSRKIMVFVKVDLLHVGLPVKSQLPE